MKQQFNITKIGNSLFATLPNKLVKQLQLKSGDQVSYEIIPGKKKVLMNIAPQGKRDDSTSIVEALAEEDKQWITEMAGSLSTK